MPARNQIRRFLYHGHIAIAVQRRNLNHIAFDYQFGDAALIDGIEQIGIVFLRQSRFKVVDHTAKKKDEAENKKNQQIPDQDCHAFITLPLVSLLHVLCFG